MGMRDLLSSADVGALMGGPFIGKFSPQRLSGLSSLRSAAMLLFLASVPMFVASVPMSASVPSSSQLAAELVRVDVSGLSATVCEASPLGGISFLSACLAAGRRACAR